MRVLDLPAGRPLPDLPPIAEIVVPLLALSSCDVSCARSCSSPAAASGADLPLRRRRAALCPAGRRRPGRLHDANADRSRPARHSAARGRRAGADVLCSSRTARARQRDVHVVAEVRSCRPGADGSRASARVSPSSSRRRACADGVVLRRLQPPGGARHARPAAPPRARRAAGRLPSAGPAAGRELEPVASVAARLARPRGAAARMNGRTTAGEPVTGAQYTEMSCL